MDKLISEKVLTRLRVDAESSTRPRERNATIDRLVEACDAIASGKAHRVVSNGLPEAAFHFLRDPVLIKPPRVDEYVRACRRLEAHARRGNSKWTGPTATTLRKDKGLLEYVRAREEEQLASVFQPVARDLMQLLDKVLDLSLRTELRFALAHGKRAEEDLRRLKEGMRRLSPTVDVDAIIAGNSKRAVVKTTDNALALTADRPCGEKVRSSAAMAVQKLLDVRCLSRVGLELNDKFGNLIERKTRVELLSGNDIEALKDLVGMPTSCR